VGASVLRSISLSVGSPDIQEAAYSDTLDRIGRNNATELVDLAIKLDHFEAYPFEEIKRLKRQCGENRFAENVLRDLVIANMYVFEIGREMRQRVIATLKVTSPGPAALSRNKKRF
jgi:hypothetical protein